jgi:hypothetical protein
MNRGEGRRAIRRYYVALRACRRGASGGPETVSR